MKTARIGDGLYEVSGFGGGAYRSQFVDLGSFVVAFEAPLGYPVSRQVIAQIRKTVGDKPIRYVVISHFHSDHAGGVGAYMEEGATIVTTQDAGKVLAAYATARSAFSGQTPVTAGPGPLFHFMEGPRFEITGDAGRSLMVLRAPRNPHVVEMLMMYDPANRTLIQGDLYSNLVTPNATFRAFAGWLTGGDSPVIDQIVGTHHAPLGRDEFLTHQGDGLNGHID
jgi:flavorubredoxin